MPSDLFNQNTGSDQAIATYGPWAAILGGFVVPTGNIGQYRSNGAAADNLARWTGAVPSGDHEAIVTVTAGWITHGYFAGPAIGLASGAADGYAFGCDGASYFVGKWVAGAEADLASGSLSLTAGGGDRLKISKTVSGGTVTIKVWRALAASPTVFSQVGSNITDSSSAFTAGTYGIYGYDNVTGASGSVGGGPWNGNDLAAVPSIGQRKRTTHPGRHPGRFMRRMRTRRNNIAAPPPATQNLGGTFIGPDEILFPGILFIPPILGSSRGRRLMHPGRGPYHFLRFSKRRRDTSSLPPATQNLGGGYTAPDETLFLGLGAPQPVGLAGSFIRTDESANPGTLAALFAIAGAYVATDDKLNPGVVAAGVVALAGLFAFTDEIARTGAIAQATSLLGSYIAPDEKAFAGTVGAGAVALAGGFARPDETTFPGTLAAIFALAGAYAITDEQARAGSLATFAALSGFFSPTDERTFLASVAVGAVALAGFSVVTDEVSGPGLASLGGQALAGAYIGTDERANAGALTLGAFSVLGAFCATDEQAYAASLATLRALQGLGILTDERASAGAAALNGSNLSGSFSTTDERANPGAATPSAIPIQGGAIGTDEHTFPGVAALGGQVLSGSFGATDEAVRAGASAIGSAPLAGVFSGSDEQININTATPATIALLGTAIRSDERTLSGVLTAAYALAGAPITSDESLRTAIVTVGLVTLVGVYSKTDELVFQSIIVRGQLIFKTLRARGAYRNAVRKVGAYG